MENDNKEPQSTAETEAIAANQRMKDQARQQLAADMEAFLKAGGRVTSVADNVRADPPRKPDNQYGSSPI